MRHLTLFNPIPNFRRVLHSRSPLSDGDNSRMVSRQTDITVFSGANAPSRAQNGGGGMLAAPVSQQRVSGERTNTSMRPVPQPRHGTPDSRVRRVRVAEEDDLENTDNEMDVDDEESTGEFRDFINDDTFSMHSSTSGYTAE